MNNEFDYLNVKNPSGGRVNVYACDLEARSQILAINNSKGANGGIATLGNDGKVPTSQIPSYIEKARVVSVSSNLTNQTTSIAQGESEVVVYVNSGSTTDYTIAVASTYKTPYGEAIELTCPKGGYCEVNYINIGGTIYVRGL